MIDHVVHNRLRVGALLGALACVGTSNVAAQAPLDTAQVAERASPATATIGAVGAAGDTIGQGTAGDGGRTSRYSRTRSPRASVAGHYLVVVRWYDAEKQPMDVAQIGAMFADGEAGLLAVRHVRDTTWSDSTRVHPVTRWRTNATADVVLRAGGLTWDGYQTDDGGFVVGSPSRDAQGRTQTALMTGTPAAKRLSENDGLYDVSVRTRYHTRTGPANVVGDWSGTLVVVFANGVVHAHMSLRNTQGGSTYFGGSAALAPDMTFDIVDDAGSRLSGRFHDGQLVADWRDQRADGGYFQGRLTAERR